MIFLFIICNVESPPASKSEPAAQNKLSNGGSSLLSSPHSAISSASDPGPSPHSAIMREISHDPEGEEVRFAGTKKSFLRVTGMTCSSCVALIEGKMARHDGNLK